MKIHVCSHAVLAAVFLAACSPASPALTIVQPSRGEVMKVDSPQIVVDLGEASKERWQVTLNGVPEGRFFQKQGSRIKAAIWDLDIPGLQAQGNILRVEAGTQHAELVFDVEQDRAMIIKDNWGIPHVYAFDEALMYYAMGYAQSDDDHLAFIFETAQKESGNAMALKGFSPKNLMHDYEMKLWERIAMVKEHWDKIPKWSQQNTRAFADGINRFAREHRPDLARRFQITPYHVVAAGRKGVISRTNFMARMQLEYANNAVEIGEDVWKRFHMAFKVEPILYWMRETRSALKRYDTMSNDEAGFTPMNDWALASVTMSREAVADENNATGVAVTRSLAANGEALFGASLMYPAVDKNSYEIHIRAPGIDAAGQLNIGSPVFPFGFTRYMAWSLLTHRSASSDIYEEKVKINHRGEPTHYQYKGKWLPIVRKDMLFHIRQKNGKISKMHIPAFFTRNGRLQILRRGTGKYNEKLAGGNRVTWAEKKDGQWYAYSINNTMMDEPNQVTMAMNFYRVRNFDQLREEFRKMYSPIFAYLFMDRNGEVYYQHCGRIPVKKNVPRHEFNTTGHWLFPYKGYKGEGEWTGQLVSFQDLPWYDSRKMGPPSRGYIFLAAQAQPPTHDIHKYPKGIYMYSKEYPRFIWHMPPARWISQYYMHEWFQKQEHVDADDLWGLLSDPYAPVVGWLKPALIEAYEKSPGLIAPGSRQTAEEAIALLKKSSASGTLENMGFLMATCWIRKLYDRVFHDELGAYCGDMGTKRLVLTNGMLLLSMIYRPDLKLHLDPYPQIASFIDDTTTPNRETKEQMAVLALQDAVEYMMEKYGRVAVRWGDVERYTRGGVSLEREGAFQWAGAMLRKDGPEAGFGFPKSYNPLYRMVVKMKQTPEAYTVTMAGQSSDPSSPHHLDQTRLCFKNRYKKFNFTWRDVTAHEESREYLTWHQPDI